MTLKFPFYVCFLRQMCVDSDKDDDVAKVDRVRRLIGLGKTSVLVHTTSYVRMQVE